MADIVIIPPKLYEDLKVKARTRKANYSMQDTIVRLRHGIKKIHASNIFALYWWHIFVTDRSLYDRLKSVGDEETTRQIFGGRAMPTYVQGEKTITICSDMFSPEFFEIIAAYVDYTDELSYTDD